MYTQTVNSILYNISMGTYTPYNLRGRNSPVI